MARDKASTEDPLVQQAFDANKHEDLARAISQLDPEAAAYFLAKLESAIKKRKIQIAGYLAAMLIWVLAMFAALAYYGTHDGFVGWVFLIPFGLVGGILWAFGRWAEAVGNSVQAPEVVKAKVVKGAPAAAKAGKAGKDQDNTKAKDKAEAS